MCSNSSFILECNTIDCLIDFLDIFDSWKLINSCKILLNNKKIFNISLPYVEYLRQKTVMFFDKTGQLVIVPKVKHIDYTIIKILRIYKIDYLVFFNKLIRMKYKYKHTKKIIKTILNHVNHVELCTLISNNVVFDLFHSYYHIFNKQYILSFDIILNSLHNLDYFSIETMHIHVQILIYWFKLVQTEDEKTTSIIKFLLTIMISQIIINTRIIESVHTHKRMYKFMDVVSAKILEFKKVIIDKYNIQCEHIIDKIISELSNLQMQIS